jgi:hypothetical protein
VPLYLAIGACVVAAGVLVFVLLRDSGDGEGDGDTVAASDTTVGGELSCGSVSGRCAAITDLRLEGGTYVASYEVKDFDPIIFDEANGVGSAEDHHVHFYYDTIAAENAGTNGPSPGIWEIWDRLRDNGQFRFDAFTQANQGEKGGDGAGKLCIAVADSAHGVEADSGNCVDLPTA